MFDVRVMIPAVWSVLHLGCSYEFASGTGGTGPGGSGPGSTGRSSSATLQTVDASSVVASTSTTTAASSSSGGVLCGNGALDAGEVCDTLPDPDGRNTCFGCQDTCPVPANFVDPETKHCYLVAFENEWFSGAAARCATWHPSAYLAELRSPNELTVVAGQTLPFSVYFGLRYSSGSWWWNRDPSGMLENTETNWDNSPVQQPNDPLETCGMISRAANSDDDTQWHDASCFLTSAADEVGYLCELEP